MREMIKRNFGILYLCITLIYEAFLVLEMKPISSLYHLVPFIIFVAIDSVFEKNDLKKSAKCAIPLLGFIVIWGMHFGFFEISTYVIIIFSSYLYMGFKISQKDKKNNCLIAFIIILTIIAIVSMIFHFLQINPLINYFPAAGVFANSTRMSLIFVHPIPAATIFTVYILLCVFFIENKIAKICTTILGVLILFFTGSRSCMLSFLISIIFYCVMYLIKHKNCVKAINSKKTAMITFFLFFFLIIIIISIPSLRNQAQSMLNRITSSKEELGNNFYRFMAWKLMLSTVWPSNGWKLRFLGVGNQTCLITMQLFQSEEMILAGAGVQAGTVDNTYLSLLYDYGLLAFILMIFGIIYIIYKILKGNDKQMKIAIIIFNLQLCAISFDMQYWSSISFIALYFMGYLLGVSDEVGKI